MLEKMIQLAEQAMSHAHMPYSDFPVGACLRTSNNKLYAGCNVENMSYRLGACAEVSAICGMVSAEGKQMIEEIVIVAKKMLICPPCGACRQNIFEFAHAKTLIHLCGDGKVQKTLTMAELLPESFVFEK